MIRGLYTSGWSMLALEKKMDVIANNMANAATTGYKKDTVVYESFPEVLTKRIHDTRSRLNPSGMPGPVSLGSDVGEIFTYFGQGQLVSTSNNSDLAIDDSNSAFFTVLGVDKEGNEREYYTRDGSFIVGTGNMLMTSDGYVVMGLDGPIVLRGDSFTLTPDGSIIQDEEVVGSLLIREFADPNTLRKIGQNLFQATDQTEEQPFTGTVRQGYLEQSNVDIVKEMVNMITVMRAYETNQKILQAADSTLERAVNQIGALN
jgi:flagellar basal-body rod protein FlgF